MEQNIKIRKTIQLLSKFGISDSDENLDWIMNWLDGGTDTDGLNPVEKSITSQLNSMMIVINKRDLGEIDSYLRASQKLQAVKHLKQVSGLGLKEAKDVCDTAATKI